MSAQTIFNDIFGQIDAMTEAGRAPTGVRVGIDRLPALIASMPPGAVEIRVLGFAVQVLIEDPAAEPVVIG